MSKHWSMGLLESMRDTNLRIISSDIAVVIRDKFPKAKYHFLVLPFDDIASIFQLSKSHIDLIDELELLGVNAIEVTGQQTGDFKLGFHASPSMQRLHLHVISQDFDSPSLKTKIHWNSFNTEFFISCDEVRSSLNLLGRVEKWPESRIKELKNTPLKCNQCAFNPKNIPDLKQHLIKHVKS